MQIVYVLPTRWTSRRIAETTIYARATFNSAAFFHSTSTFFIHLQTFRFGVRIARVYVRICMYDLDFSQWHVFGCDHAGRSVKHRAGRRHNDTQMCQCLMEAETCPRISFVVLPVFDGRRPVLRSVVFSRQVSGEIPDYFRPDYCQSYQHTSYGIKCQVPRPILCTVPFTTFADHSCDGNINLLI